MMSRLEIPGYYFDEQKGKYFKIEKSHAALPSAAWSSDNVKKRRVEDEAHRAAEQRRRLLRHHIRRHPALTNDDFISGLLDREVGAPSAAKGLEARVTREYGEGEVRGRCWARGLVGKGEVPFAPSFARGRMANMGCFWVDGGDERTGMGVGYAGLDEEMLVGSYIPTDKNETICFSRESTYMRPLLTPPYRTEIVRCPQMSSIKYHAPTHKMLLTSRELDHSAGLYIFSPPLSEEGSGQPRWLLGEANQYQRLSTLHRLRDQWVVHSVTPAPPSAPETLCILGTNAGILRVSSNEAVSWLSAPLPSSSSSSFPRKPPPGPQLPREIFSQDFQIDNPNVLYAGGRQARLWRADLRTGAGAWGFEAVGSSLAHVRSLGGGREVLVAGPRDFMAVYDVRMFRKGGGAGLARPVLTFPEHKNEAHIHVGLDISHDLGVVAAGQGDGTVKLFSTMSGRVLKPGGGGGGAADGLGGVKTDTPIKAVMFQKMPWERWESLWVAAGPALKKFSFGARRWEDEA